MQLISERLAQEKAVFERIVGIDEELVLPDFFPFEVECGACAHPGASRAPVQFPIRKHAHFPAVMIFCVGVYGCDPGPLIGGVQLVAIRIRLVNDLLLFIKNP